MKHLLYFVLLSIIFTVSVTSCGCEPGVQTTSTTTTSSTGSVSILRLYGIDPYTLDPALAAEMTSHTYITQLYSGLVQFNKNLEPVPDVAERWELSSDRTVYTFYLRQDVVFHDGRAVTASDVKYSWERACSPATGSPVAQTYLGDIVGATGMLAGQSSSLTGVKVLDTYTLEVTIDAPKSYFLYKLTYPTAFIVDEESVNKGSNWWLTPNGTGPFKLQSWTQGQSLVLVPNERYHGQAASLHRIEYGLWSGIPMIMYETGELDVAGVSVNYIDRVNDPEGPFVGQLQVSPELSFSYIGFNAKEPPFDDAHVRRAFTMAVDKQRIIDVMYRNLVDNAAGILPPGMPGYNETIHGLAFDIEAAKAELALSRYGSADNLPDIVLTTSGYGGSISGHLEAAITMWRENLGVEVSVRVLDPRFYLYNLIDEKDQIYDMGWVADYPHPQNFLDILFRSGSENNFGEYSNPDVDNLLDEAAAALNQEEGFTLYQQIEQMLIDDAAVLPLWFGQNYILVKPYVKGYELNPMGLPALNQVRIEQ